MSMNDSNRSDEDESPYSNTTFDHALRNEFRKRLEECLAADAALPRIEEFLERGDPAARDRLFQELLRTELDVLAAANRPAASDYRERFAEYHEIIEALLETVALGGARESSALDPAQTDPAVDSSALWSAEFCPAGDHASTIGRYRIERLLGCGGFAFVYKAWDPELKRLVALKVPRRDKLRKITDANKREALLRLFADEAHKTAQLDHPAIVRVHDVLRDPGTVCIVQEYIDGIDLGRHSRKSPRTPRQCAELLMAIADAVGYAHAKRFWHRDLKPQNILVDASGQPHVADFGLALHESAQHRHVGQFAGTLEYMSPEQVRCETNRLDGRTDLWSLGVIFYELLTGHRPFTERREALFDEILHRDPKPPRMIDPQLPAELSRICLACLAKRATDRYGSAADLIEDLRMWLDGKTPAEPAPPASDPNRSSSATGRAVIVPKGLPSYDASDAYFFLEMLPGPYDREGLPKRVRFWKTQLEQRDADATFPVGFMYGPSGCGKSSLVKAALLPRLSADVKAIYIEATANDTESRLTHALKKLSPEPAPEPASEPTSDTALPNLVARLRDRGGSRGRKVVLILDQFEQWLHAHARLEDTPLITALRQCDGANVQALVLVRDDFWMSITRFMDALEVPPVEGHNSGAVDLFDVDHATKVLALFGQGYGKLPLPPAELTADQRNFLARAVHELVDPENGKVVSVQLALFALMLEGRPWSVASLHEVGGTTGLGANFLEEKLSAKTAAPSHRLHQVAARGVLQCLLPEEQTEIKGQMRSYDELLAAAGYQTRRSHFDTLLRILDSELRLITPTESSVDNPSSRFYQLTHDYLVPSLRDWLTRKQRETRRGRAELLLAQRASDWNAKSENRQLPSLWEYLHIRVLTDARRWSDLQRTMMGRAARLHAIRAVAVTVALVVLLSLGMVLNTSIRTQGLVGRLISAEPSELSSVIEELNKNPNAAARYLAPLLSPPTASLTPEDKRAQLHARIASVSRDPSLVEPLLEEMLAGKATYVIPIRQQLRASSATLIGRLQTLLRNETADSKRRFHAALALADYLPASDSKAWTDSDLKFVAEQLVASNAEFQPLLREALRPIHAKLLPPLDRIYRDAKATTAERVGAANAFADYAAKDPARLANLLIEGTLEQYSILYPLVEAGRSPAIIADMSRIASTLPAADLGVEKRVEFGQRRANAAVTLLRWGEREKTLAVFGMTDDPEALTQFIFRCRPRGVGVEALLDCLEIVSTAPPGRYAKESRYALLLALAEFRLSEVPENRRPSVLKQVRDWYANDPSSGVHGAANWLLRQWGENAYVKQIDETPMAPSADREWFTLAVKVKPEAPSSPLSRLFEFKSATPTTLYYTFVVFPAGEYTIGSPEDEPERFSNEIRHKVSLSRPFALLNREVTFAELIAFQPEYDDALKQVPQWRPELAGAFVDWYDAVQFSRWLGTQLDPPLSEADQAYADPESPTSGERESGSQASWAPKNWPVDVSRRGFRLPSEAEFEIACRSGVLTSYGFGSDVGLLDRYGWYAANSGGRMHVPMELRPGHRGLFDMHGNALEWVHDRPRDYILADSTNPLSNDQGSYRVARGGNWVIDAADCRSAYRSRFGPTIRTNVLGFRLALSFVGVPAEPRGDKKD